jgi:hypothetical protein
MGSMMSGMMGGIGSAAGAVGGAVGSAAGAVGSAAGSVVGALGSNSEGGGLLGNSGGLLGTGLGTSGGLYGLGNTGLGKSLKKDSGGSSNESAFGSPQNAAGSQMQSLMAIVKRLMSASGGSNKLTSPMGGVLGGDPGGEMNAGGIPGNYGGE